MIKILNTISIRSKNVKSCVVILLFPLMVACNGQSQQRSPNNKINDTDTSINKIETIKPGAGTTCGFLDREGILWFGTYNEGVFRFDGTSFTNYSTKNGLCGNKVSCITEDKDGNLWFGIADGLCKYDRKSFTHISIPKYNISTKWLKNSYPAVNPNEVQSIVQDKNGIFWLGTNGAGAYRYDGTTFTNYLSKIGAKQPDSLYHNIIQSITEDKKGNLWFTSMSHGGVSRYDGESFTQFMPIDGLSDDMVRTSFADRKGKIWFGFNGNRKSGLTYYDGQSFKTYSKDDGICNTNIRGIYEDKKGNLWLASGRGNLCVFDGKEFLDFTTEEGQTFNEILFTLEDTKGNIWFGGKNQLWLFNGETATDMTK